MNGWSDMATWWPKNWYISISKCFLIFYVRMKILQSSENGGSKFPCPVKNSDGYIPRSLAFYQPLQWHTSPKTHWIYHHLLTSPCPWKSKIALANCLLPDQNRRRMKEGGSRTPWHRTRAPWGPTVGLLDGAAVWLVVLWCEEVWAHTELARLCLEVHRYSSGVDIVTPCPGVQPLNYVTMLELTSSYQK